jgi:hypothetical protein
MEQQMAVQVESAGCQLIARKFNVSKRRLHALSTRCVILQPLPPISILSIMTIFLFLFGAFASAAERLMFLSASVCVPGGSGMNTFLSIGGIVISPSIAV